MSGTWSMVALDLAVVVAVVSVAKLLSDRVDGVAARWVWFVVLSAAFVFIFVAVPLRVALRRQQRRLLQLTDQARQAAATDPLTGLANRRTADQTARSLIDGDVPFAVAICDLDHFKRLNDGFGHDTGDAALRLFAETLRSVVRHGDVVSRHGGEEFLLILPHARKEHGVLVLDRARLELTVVLGEHTCPPYTFSAGVADSTESPDWTTLLRLADQRLLDAKRAGRDRVLSDVVCALPA